MFFAGDCTPVFEACSRCCNLNLAWLKHPHCPVLICVACLLNVILYWYFVFWLIVGVYTNLVLVCIFVYWFVYLYIGLYIHLFVCIFVNWFVYL